MAGINSCFTGASASEILGIQEGVYQEKEGHAIGLKVLKG